MNDHSPTAEAAGYTTTVGRLALQDSALQAALSKAQGEMAAAAKDRKNPHLKSTYATLASVIDVIREPFVKHGLSHWAVPSMDLELGIVRVDVFVGHADGGQIMAPLSAKLDVGKGLSAIQAAGVLITYMRRYGLMSLAGISSADDPGDNDGMLPPREDDPPPRQAPAPKLNADTDKLNDLVALALSSARSARTEEDLHKIRVILNGEESKALLAAHPSAAAAVRAELQAAKVRLAPLAVDPHAAESLPKLGE